MFYKVTVQWGHKTVTHYSYTYRDAVKWTQMYPRKDMIAVIKPMNFLFPAPKKVIYYR